MIQDMRMWSLHPKYLDRKGLLAGWREGLLAQQVLLGLTQGYRHHPQLIRFRLAPDPIAAIGTYLAALATEARSRHYQFDSSKLRIPNGAAALTVTKGQVQFEWYHLLAKLNLRDPNRWQTFQSLTFPDVHPLFRIIDGKIEDWERHRECQI